MRVGRFRRKVRFLPPPPQVPIVHMYAYLGIHWRIIYRESPKHLLVFDSLGNTEDILQQIYKFDHTSQVDCNFTAVQSKSSQSCGYFSLFWIVQKILNPDIPFQQLLNEDFGSNFEQNERTVFEGLHELDIL